MRYLKQNQTVAVEFPEGWEPGWTITGRVPDIGTDMQGRTFKYRYNVKHSDGRVIRDIHPQCARAA